MCRKVIDIMYGRFTELFIYYHLHNIRQMIYNIMFNLHKSHIFYSHDRIKIYRFFLKSDISKKITVIQDANIRIISIDDFNATAQYNVQTVTLITFFKNALILLKVLDGCSMIQLRQIVLAQMAEYCRALQTVSLYLGRCCLHRLWRFPSKKFHDDVPYRKPVWPGNYFSSLSTWMTGNLSPKCPKGITGRAGGVDR